MPWAKSLWLAFQSSLSDLPIVYWPSEVLEPQYVQQHRTPYRLHTLLASSEKVEANPHDPLCSPCRQYTWWLILPAYVYQILIRQ